VLPLLQESPAHLVLLISDLAAVLASPVSLFQDLSAAVSQQEQQQGAASTSGTQPSTGAAGEHTAGELSALQAAMQQASKNLQSIQQDQLLAGELSAVGGYWLLRRFLPALHGQPELVLQGLAALPGLGYRVSFQLWIPAGPGMLALCMRPCPCRAYVHPLLPWLCVSFCMPSAVLGCCDLRRTLPCCCAVLGA
jgi:hypothetical protein